MNQCQQPYTFNGYQQPMQQPMHQPMHCDCHSIPPCYPPMPYPVPAHKDCSCYKEFAFSLMDKFYVVNAQGTAGKNLATDFGQLLANLKKDLDTNVAKIKQLTPAVEAAKLEYENCIAGSSTDCNCCCCCCQESHETSSNCMELEKKWRTLQQDLNTLEGMTIEEALAIKTLECTINTMLERAAVQLEEAKALKSEADMYFNRYDECMKTPY